MERNVEQESERREETCWYCQDLQGACKMIPASAEKLEQNRFAK